MASVQKQNKKQKYWVRMDVKSWRLFIIKREFSFFFCLSHAIESCWRLGIHSVSNKINAQTTSLAKTFYFAKILCLDMKYKIIVFKESSSRLILTKNTSSMPNVRFCQTIFRQSFNHINAQILLWHTINYLKHTS